ncbi:MAG TPA: lipid-A-disaccharide synthase [Hyphomonadaceae bacterium]|nr:lipid-A-disaccharide synthase [Hyphomonadaceae bacterium]
MRHIFLVAAEDSGDALGADVIDALRSADPGVRISGIGGGKMRERGVASDVDMSGLAVLGFIDGLRAFGRVKRAVESAGEAIIKADPDAVVLIDSWGFMWRLARLLKERGNRAKRIKLIGPQVWATRPGRARVLAQWCDHLLCIHAFEQPFYERWGLATTVIGNPALHRMEKGDAARFRVSRDIAAGRRIIGLLPGSRRSEIRRVAPTLVAACERLTAGHDDRIVVCVAAESVQPSVREMAKAWRFPHIIVAGETGKADAFASMEVAVACSGTVTTELAAQGAAIVVGYKLGWVTWAIARLFLMRSKFITLLNVAAGREVAPEFVQTRFTPSKVAAAAERLLSDPRALEAQRRGQDEALKLMAGPGRPAAELAAETILGLA